MRIITGILKGRNINIPKTLNVRPTAARTKEGLFSVLDARKYIRDASVLDLFAGSGNLGVEAISRGAGSVLFVDSDRRNIRHIEKVSEKFNITSKIRTVTAKVEDYLQGPSVPYDIIFSDPPYDYEYMTDMIDIILGEGWLNERGWLILEHDKRHDFENHEYCIYSKAYGRTIVSIFALYGPDEDTQE